MNTSKQILLSLILSSASFSLAAGTPLPGLEAPVTVVRDATGTPHIFAQNEHDLFFMQGWTHAEDRLFQMDLLRRQADGTLAEVLGLPALPIDVQSRVIGLDRAAARSLSAHSSEMLDVLDAYSTGVNAFVAAAARAGRLPPEYGALELTQVREWTPLDSLLVAKALAAATSLIVSDDIELTIALQAYQGIGQFADFDGSQLFFGDLFRSAPFDLASTVPDAEGLFAAAETASKVGPKVHGSGPQLSEQALEHSRGYLKRIRKLPKIPGVLPHDGGDMGGSNTWVVSGAHTPDGHPMLANDIHLRLESPTIFYEVHLAAPSIDVTGSSLAGAPCVIRGHNQHVAWGITNARLDITDIYAELIVQDSQALSGFRTVHGTTTEEIDVRIESFQANIGGNLVPVLQTPVLIVPRRNNGPLITAPAPVPGTDFLTALSVQSVGFGPTRDPEGICALNRARTLEEFKAGLQLIDFASQNITYADTEGNIAYFVTGELPLREDLQNPQPGVPVAPPFLIRNGSGGNDWLPPAPDNQPANQATPFQILPFDEMPQVQNPDGGIIINANNDQIGNTLDNNPLNDLREGDNGLRYLNWGGRYFSIRAGRISEMIAERLTRGSGILSFGQMKNMQADTVLNDAKALVPFILDAFDNGARDGADTFLAALAADPRVAEAVGRLRVWNFTTPTGIVQGHDADPDEVEVGASVAATIYSVWRGAIVANTIDATLDGLGLGSVPRPGRREELVTALKHLLVNDGIGESGVNFFNVPDVAEAEARRDIVVLASLRDALDLLASDAFALAFGNSTIQDDYRWGKLHRIVFRHPLGAADERFNVPPAFGLFPGPLEAEGLAGIPVDGGFETVDAAPPLDANNVRVSDSDSFMFDFAPTGRFVARLVPGKVKAETSLPGGESAIPFSPFYLNLLEPWLANETHRMLVRTDDVLENAFLIQDFEPAGP